LSDITQFIFGTILGVLIAVLAYRAGSLSRSGAWAAAFTGAVIFGLGGLAWAVLLLVFFTSSSLLSRLFVTRKQSVEEKFSKSARRDWAQVTANGGLGVLLVILVTILPDQDWIWWAYSGAMAAVNADTWATELGVLSAKPPRLITTGRVVERGTSGAISTTGTLAAVGGAVFVGMAAMLFMPQPQSWFLLLVTGVAGLLGSLVDSFLGATLQAVYFCPVCYKETERFPQHLCGTATTYHRGWRWMNNDWVNWICSLAGALAAILGWIWLG
jgi:uncharacterized protein (TIGR00297 family)